MITATSTDYWNTLTPFIQIGASHGLGGGGGKTANKPKPCFLF